MTDSDFIDFFHRVLGGLPNYARNSIRNYWADNSISYEVVISDEAVDRIERAHKQICESAILSVWDTERKWQFAFREFLRAARPPVLTTIIQHELIHGFLCPFLHPFPNQKPLSNLATNKFTEFEATLKTILADPQLANDPTPYEEKLVLVIQGYFHGDEQTANEWVHLNSPSRQKSSL